MTVSRGRIRGRCLILQVLAVVMWGMVSVAFAQGSPDPLPAFPGAEGFGTETPGGRGGRVYVVTTLSWRGSGSFSEALFAPEPRIIVFAVSGVIRVPKNTPALTAAHSFVTVAGQTSPGGITFVGGGVALKSYRSGFHDGVFRFLRFRGRTSYDNVSLNTTHHVVFDHCDFSGGTDEALDITFSRDFTVQWSTISNSGPRGQRYGALFAYSPTDGVSFHHNLSAHHAGRCAPHLHWSGGGVKGGVRYDFRNNVIYNCGKTRLMHLSAGKAPEVLFNMIGNYAKAGPSTPVGKNTFFTNLGGNVSLFARDNVYEEDIPVFPKVYHRPKLVVKPHAFPKVTTMDSQIAYESVLQRAGAWPRDAMNERTASEVRSGSGRLGNVSDALITSGPRAPVDEDLDGMADEWERAVGLDPHDSSDAALDRDGDGYTNIEEYVNRLAARIVPG